MTNLHINPYAIHKIPVSGLLKWATRSLCGVTERKQLEHSDT
jgi:hypothetical protein